MAQYYAMKLFNFGADLLDEDWECLAVLSLCPSINEE